MLNRLALQGSLRNLHDLLTQRKPTAIRCGFVSLGLLGED
jgi:hypothetical protein